jgi:Zn-dependent protease
MRGSLQIGRWRGVPVYVHWTAPIGCLLFFQLDVRPVAWACFFALIFLHERGHAVIARALRVQPTSILIHGFGGECAVAGTMTKVGRAQLAWGGVLGQIPALVVGLLLMQLPRGGPLVEEAAATLVYVNAYVAIINLLPIPMFDGWQAWRLFAPENLATMFRAWRRGAKRARLREIERELARLRAGHDDHGLN